MGRTPNDDRSDSKNPNNDAYWASEDNRHSQIGGGDDDDDDGIGAQADAATVFPATQPAPIAESRPARELRVNVSVVIDEPRSVDGLYLLYLETENPREYRIRVHSPSIEAAILEAQALWDKGGLVFMALYDQGATYLEKARADIFQASVTTELAALGDLHALVQIADKDLAYAKRALDEHLGKDSRHEVSASIRHFGAYKAASDALHAELAERTQALARQGVQVTLASLHALALSAKLFSKADASAQWIKDYQLGKIRLDPITMAFERREKIADVKTSGPARQA